MILIRRLAAGTPLLIGILLLSINIEKPFIGQHDWNGVVYGQQAKNFVRYGYLPLRFGATLSIGKKPLDELMFSTHYPPTLPLLISVSYRLFGVHEWSTRLIPTIASMSSILLTMMLATKLVSYRVGFIAGCLAILTPMFVYYGNNPVHEVVQLPFSLLAFYAYRSWFQSGQRRWLIVLFVSLTAAMAVGWEGYYATVFISLHGLLFGQRKRILITLPLLGLMSFVVFLWYATLLSPGTRLSIWETAMARTGSGAFKFISWFGRETRYAINLFTATVLGLSGFWAIRTARAVFQKDNILLLFLGLYGVAHVVIFRDAGWYHEYLLFPFFPFLAITSAMVLGDILKKARSLTGRIVALSIVLIMVAFERAGYARALLSSEYVRATYEEALRYRTEEISANTAGSLEGKNIFFIFYGDRL